MYMCASSTAPTEARRQHHIPLIWSFLPHQLPAMGTHTCHTSTQEAEIGRSKA